VLASGSYSTAGLYPGMLEGIAQMQPEMFEGTPFLDEYRSIAPRPEDFGRLLERTKEIDSTIPEYSPEQVRAVTAPTLLIAADSDIIRPEHTVEFFRLLGGGRNGDIEGMPESQLLVVPGASHVTVVQQPAVVLPAIDSFLDADPAAQ
jgi:pimeloyl-ACP methyl ester carboxylesterase